MGAFKLVIGTVMVAKGTLLHVIGMATHYWCSFKIAGVEETVGLFEACYGGHCSHSDEPRSQDKAVQALAVLGLIVAVIGLTAALIFCLRVYCRKSPMRLIRLVAAIFSLIASVFLIICIVVYAGKIFKDFKDRGEFTDQKLGYSFGLTTCGGILFLLGGLILLCATGYELEHYTL